jgi:hypothetical protein
MPSVNRLTIDRTVDLWHQVGRHEFFYHEVKDRLTDPRQLFAMKNRGYVKKIRMERITLSTVPHWTTVWQMTEQARWLAEEMEGTSASTA